MGGLVVSERCQPLPHRWNSPTFSFYPFHCFNTLSSVLWIGPPPPLVAPSPPSPAPTFTKTCPPTGTNLKTTFGSLIPVPTPSLWSLPLPLECVEVTWRIAHWKVPMLGSPPAGVSSWSEPGSKYIFSVYASVWNAIVGVWVIWFNPCWKLLIIAVEEMYYLLRSVEETKHTVRSLVDFGISCREGYFIPMRSIEMWCA